MPVTDTHEQYALWAPWWRRIRDVVGGTPYVKRRDNWERYLVRPSGMKREGEFQEYVNLTNFFGASGRTLRGWVGTVFRKPMPDPENVRPRMLFRLRDMDRSRTPIDALAVMIIEEILQVGRYGIWLDQPSNATGVTFPYCVTFETEQMFDWEWAVLDTGEIGLSHLRIEDSTVDRDPKDEFKKIARKRIRVLELDADGFYHVRVFKENENKRMVEHTDEMRMPTRQNQRLRFIPFYIFNPTRSLTFDIQPPPILDLVEENLAHYRASADYENARHITGSPTPWIASDNVITEEMANVDVKLGSRTCLKLGTGGEARFLSLSGSELTALGAPLKEHKENMAMLGSRLLEPQRASVEATETHLLRHAGETASLISVVDQATEGLTWLLQKMAWWGGENEATANQIRQGFNKDFIPLQIDPAVLRELHAQLQAGSISQDTYLWNLQQGEVLPPGRTIEHEKELIEQDTGRLLGLRGDEGI